MNYRNVIVALVALGICVQARSGTLSTTDGATYSNITTQRADPDGLYIEYSLPGGGLGMSKVKFSRLSPDQQKQFGYDAGKAKDFEAKVAAATEDWRQENARLEQAAKAAQIEKRFREQQESRDETERLMALAQLKQSEAALGHDVDNGAGFGYSYGGGIGLFAIPQINQHVRASTKSIPVASPPAFVTRQIHSSLR